MNTETVAPRLIGSSDLLHRIREDSRQLTEWKRHEYPIGCIVRVGDNYGLASAEDGCPPDKLPVRFENNNVWWKPLETISRVTDLKAIPPWVRRMKLRWAGYAV